MGDVQNHQNVSTREVKTNPKGYIMYNHCVWNLHGASIFLPQDVGKTPETSHFHPDPAPWGPWLPLGPLGTHHGSLAVHLSQLFTFLQDVLCRRNSVDGDNTGKNLGVVGCAQKNNLYSHKYQYKHKSKRTIHVHINTTILGYPFLH